MVNNIKLIILVFTISISISKTIASDQDAGRQVLFSVPDQSALKEPGTVYVITQASPLPICNNGSHYICTVRTTRDAPQFHPGDSIPANFVEAYESKYK